MITLEEIENISLRKAGFSGYKTEDVDDFVDEVVEKVKSLELTQKELELKIENQQSEIAKFKEKEDSVQNVLINAQLSAKQTKADAERKSQEKLDEAEAEAKRKVEEAEKKANEILSEAQEKADQLNSDTDAKVEELMNQALKESSDKIDENNRIIVEQKKSILALMSEANKFRNSLLRAYKSHLNIINSMQKGEDVKKKQKELEENYPEVQGNRPEQKTVSKPTDSDETETVQADDGEQPKEE